MESENLNSDINNKKRRTPAMQFAEAGNVKEFLRAIQAGANINYRNAQNESVISLVLDKLRLHYLHCQQQSKTGASTESYEDYMNVMNYQQILSYSIINNGDFNIPVDQDGTTGFMATMLLPDMAVKISRIYKRINLSEKNRHGENASSLCVKENWTRLFDVLVEQPTFDWGYRDPATGNTLIHLAAISQPTVLKRLLKEKDTSPKMIPVNESNFRKETALILATRSGCLASVKLLLKHPNVDVNHQDHLGNTALHYAVTLKNPYLVGCLLRKKADPTLCNGENQSPESLAHSLDDKEVLQAMAKPSNFRKFPSHKNSNLISNLYVEESPEIFQYLIPALTVDYGHKDLSDILNHSQKPFSADAAKDNDRMTCKEACTCGGGHYFVDDNCNHLCSTCSIFFLQLCGLCEMCEYI